MRLIKKIIRGAGYLEGYGHHPGWAPLGAYVLATGLAGIQNGGIRGFFGGCAFGLAFFGLFFMWGCLDRANDCDRDQAMLLKRIKHSND